jgi:MinD-like ATPase involved in chromosome partitioning or flagellar assembly
MGKIIAVHSYKGGTGKTLLSVNLAATFAKQGKKVCLFDLDFRAPSLFAILKINNAENYLNDYLNNTSDINKILIDMSSRIPGKGKFFVGLANPSTEALGRLLHLRNALLTENQYDYLVFDTSPGLQYSSINAIVAADLVAVATTSDRSDVNGTQRMLKELYNLFEKKTGIVINKVLEYNSKSKQEELQHRIKDIYQVPLLGIVPCFCDILRAEGNYIFPADKPDHPFSQLLIDMANKIEANELQ